jgi:hypothetical protein
VFLVWERIGLAKDVGNGRQDNNFTVTGTRELGTDISVADLMDVCLAENDRRLAPYDPRLLRPRLVPRMVRLARRFIRTPKRTAAASREKTDVS